jgi:type I pantothenate kinase
MEQRINDGLSPYRVFTRAEWAALREDTPMTLAAEEVKRLRSVHDRLDIAEVEEIYLPLSRHRGRESALHHWRGRLRGGG